jgi:hypothetical protein
MINSYTFLYCYFYKLLENKTKAKDRISFGVQSFIGLGLIIYLVILMIILVSDYDLYFHPNLNKYLFGLGYAIIFYSINYLLFDRNERYKGLLDKYNRIQRSERIYHIIIWTAIILLPIVLKII